MFAGRVHGAEPELIDDRAITIRSAGDVDAKRKALIHYIWGADGFPKQRLPDAVVPNVPGPLRDRSEVGRVDEIRIEQTPELQGLAYHFIPRKPNRTLVVVHHGHGCAANDDPAHPDDRNGLHQTIQALLREGYGVLGVFMPHKRPGDCRGRTAHDDLMGTTTIGSPLKYFLDPVAISLNYLKTRSREGNFPEYRDVHMVGLSGGGWTTTVYAAIDLAIRFSFPVAGTVPLYLRHGGSVGDREQYESSFYSLAGYQDLYILGAEGRGRKQVQILVRRDTCCFGEKQHDGSSVGMSYGEALRDYEGRVRAALDGIGNGSFRLEIDEIAPRHMISHHAIKDMILPELRKAR